MNADTPMVAIMQTMRLVAVLLFFPYWIKFLTRNETGAHEDVRIVTGSLEVGNTWLDKLICTPKRKIVFTFIVAQIAGAIGNFFHIPAGPMVLSILAIVSLNLTTSVCYVPLQIKTLAQLLAGSVVGCTIGHSAFSNFNHLVIPLLILLVNYWIVNFIYSMYCKRSGMLDLARLCLHQLQAVHLIWH